ncbi:MAG: DUF1156 domain-containing protein [Candidatus Sabulitectum sp.]|nr:DUF1156 domain-containing protein [Candidatus Sabulitectum sp.]
MKKPEVLIEKWLPIDIASAESMRDQSAAKKPPLNTLHVWWARRPLTTSRIAILSSLLPAWSEKWPVQFKAKYPTEQAYQEWFLLACGILGDPVTGRKRLQEARDRGEFIPNPHNSPRAFTVSPSDIILKDIKELVSFTWGENTPTIADFFAGGGSIPFEALRYDSKTIANELNPVASVILKASLDYPFSYGEDIVSDLKKYGNKLCSIVQSKLKPFFIDETKNIHDAIGSAYIWARTVACPYTGKPIPLSPNWWLSKRGKPVAVQSVFDPNSDKATFKIIRGEEECAFLKPDEGTISRGNAISPWANNQPVDGSYIKEEAQAGRMGQQLYAIAVKKSRGTEYRAPTQADLDAVDLAEAELTKRIPEWRVKGIIPDDVIPFGNKTSEPQRYGMYKWSDMFTPRQLLSICTYLEELQIIKGMLFREIPGEKAKAITTYLSFVISKAINYNAMLSSWHTGRGIMRGVFDRHDFSFKWTFGEFDATANLFPWGLKQVVNAYSGIAKLASGASKTFFDETTNSIPVQFIKGSASSVPEIPTGSVEVVVVDPPYYDNVMYSECSDFFYVWMKRSLGDVYPEWFSDQLTNKEDEAVANVARFCDMGKNKKALALADYERKMAASFREMHRVLRDDGVLTVMFTHKKVEAWDTLATSLLNAGFEIKSSWPVHTESEHSLHQAKKNAAKSTILLTCRKREPSTETVWWDDIKGEIQETARTTAEYMEKQGISGVDLYIATFGPTLSILSRDWPVMSSEVDEDTGDPIPLRPEIALDIAREEVVTLRKKGLLLGRELDFDQYTDWYLMAWDSFSAEEFPADEGRKLALAMGLDLDKDILRTKMLAKKKSSSIVLLKPEDRRKKGLVDPSKLFFDCMIDAAHTAMLLYSEDGAGACKSFMEKADLIDNTTFIGLIQALLGAIPRTRSKGEFVRPEADVLDNMRLSFFPEMEVTEIDEYARDAGDFGDQGALGV